MIEQSFGPIKVESYLQIWCSYIYSIFSSTIHQSRHRSEISQLLDVNTYLRWHDQLTADTTITTWLYGKYQYRYTNQLDQLISKFDKTNPKNAGGGSSHLQWMSCWGIKKGTFVGVVNRKCVNNWTTLENPNYGKMDLTCQNSHFNLLKFVLAKSFSKLPNTYITLREGAVAGLLFPRNGTERSLWRNFIQMRCLSFSAWGFEGVVLSQPAADLIIRRLFAVNFMTSIPTKHKGKLKCYHITTIVPQYRVPTLLARLFWISPNVNQRSSWWKHEFLPPNVNPQQQNLLKEICTISVAIKIIPPTKTMAAARARSPAEVMFGSKGWR